MTKEEWLNKHEDALLELISDEREHLLDWLSVEMRDYEDFSKLSLIEALSSAREWKPFDEEKESKEIGEVLELKKLSEEYALFELKDKKSREWEGMHMKHCVSTYNKERKVYSIRKIKTQIPICTIEIKKDKISQIKGKSNRGVHPKHIEILFKAFKHFNLDIESSDLEKIYYLEFEKEETLVLDNIFKKLKRIEYKEKDYIYFNQSLKIINDKSFKDMFTNEIDLMSIFDKNTFLDKVLKGIAISSNKEILDGIWNRKLMPMFYWEELLYSCMMKNNIPLLEFLKNKYIKFNKKELNKTHALLLLYYCDLKYIKDSGMDYIIKELATDAYGQDILRYINGLSFLSKEEKEEKILYILNLYESKCSKIEYPVGHFFYIKDYYGLSFDIISKIRKLFYSEYSYGVLKHNMEDSLKNKDVEYKKFIAEHLLFYILETRVKSNDSALIRRPGQCLSLMKYSDESLAVLLSYYRELFTIRDNKYANELIWEISEYIPLRFKISYFLQRKVSKLLKYLANKTINK